MSAYRSPRVGTVEHTAIGLERVRIAKDDSFSVSDIVYDGKICGQDKAWTLSLTHSVTLFRYAAPTVLKGISL